ncbi:uncharacterized protein METZ01_LOCUS187498 [marine metagenome]|uniref:Uncharacterized protein n=1 Tax=marine metagenome TaxID=408172 RepID=A0A382D9E1_9ZZZZ
MILFGEYLQLKLQLQTPSAKGYSLI